MSNYREPGKVNLNTINSPSVFDAVMGVQQGQQRIRFGEFWNYRRGGGPPAGGEVATSPVRGTPTSMVNVFRSGAAGDMVPDVTTAKPEGLKRSGVSLTLLREEGEAGAATGSPFFANPARDPNATQPYADANRNAAFRYQSLQRLGNLTTTRSNVFAVWLTVGYFEVFPNPSGVDAGHPDGYQLGAGAGERHGRD